MSPQNVFLPIDYMLIHLFRHGQTDKNVLRLVQGRIDEPLNRTGLEQARAASRTARLLEPQLIISSPLRRAYDTASVFAEVCGCELQAWDVLMERSMGVYEGCSWSDYEAGRESCTFSDNYSFRPEGGESNADVEARAGLAIERLRELDADRVIVVSHGIFMASLLRFAGFFPREPLNAIKFENCSRTSLRLKPELALLELNRHSEELEVLSVDPAAAISAL